MYFYEFYLNLFVFFVSNWIFLLSLACENFVFLCYESGPYGQLHKPLHLISKLNMKIYETLRVKSESLLFLFFLSVACFLSWCSGSLLVSRIYLLTWRSCCVRTHPLRKVRLEASFCLQNPTLFICVWEQLSRSLYSEWDETCNNTNVCRSVGGGPPGASARCPRSHQRLWRTPVCRWRPAGGETSWK